MARTPRWAPCIACALATTLSATALLAQIFNPNATVALGQADRLSNILNRPSDRSLFLPHDIARDPGSSDGRYWVADTFNSRVLGYSCAGATCSLPDFAAAQKLLGQPLFSSWASDGGLTGAVSATTMSFPRGVSVGPSGELAVADTGNNRVLVFSGAWGKTNGAADLVLGQSSMSGAGTGSALNKMNAPEGVFLDSSGNLWVADTGNNRVLKFASPLASGQSAAFAIGGSGAASTTTLSGPTDALLDSSGRLWVADRGFSRVLVYPTPLGSGKAATVVFGHGGSFTNGSANQGGVGAGSLGFPEKLDVDSSGNLWVADTGNQRVLEYDTPLSLDQTADRVFGQASRTQVPSFTSNGRDAPDGFPNAAGLSGPRGLLRDGAGALLVCDRENSRIVRFADPLSATVSSAVVADGEIGKQFFVDTAANIATGYRMNNPVGVAVDRSQVPNRLWAADIGNNRVLGWSTADGLTNGRAADVVLGQADFVASATNANLNGPLQNAANAVASATSLFFPYGVAVDSGGGVFVADASNSRVLQFADPFVNDATADRVFGQGGFTARNPSYPYGAADSLAGASGVAVDSAGDLWVADTLDHRVVRFADPSSQPTTGASANLVLGQAGFVSSVGFPPYSPGCARNRLSGPKGVYATSSRVYVADTGNNRVLVFDAPFADGMNASAVIGQADYVSCAANRGGSPTASTLAGPEGVWEDDAGNVYVADTMNHRVLVYGTPFAGGNLVADEVLGQPNLTTTAVTSPRPDSLAQPTGIAADSDGNLFVGDRENSRVLRYSSDPSAAVLLDSIADPIVVGQFHALTGAGFTAGSVVLLYVASSGGTIDLGPFTPTNRGSGYLFWFVPADTPLGDGHATVVVVNTDQGYIQSNPATQLLLATVPVFADGFESGSTSAWE